MLIRSILQLQQEAHVAQAKVAQQQIEIEKLKRELALRPLNVNEKIGELQLQVDQLTEMTREVSRNIRNAKVLLAKVRCYLIDEYEKNLLEPARKLREDVEAEWLPKVQALEARAKEKEVFYKALYDSVHGLKSENSRLKEVCLGILNSPNLVTDQATDRIQKTARLESVQIEYVKLLHEWELAGDQENVASSHMPTDSGFAPKNRNISHGTDMGVLRPVSDNARIASVSMQTVNRNLAFANAKGFGTRPLKEDSVFDLAKRAAAFDLSDETF